MKYSINTTKASLAEVQTTLHWGLTFITAPSAVGAPPTEVPIRIFTTGVPELTAEVVPVELQGHTIKYVGKTTKAGQITAQLFEGTDAKVAGYFLALEKAKWSGDGSDTQGVQTLTNNLKCDIKIDLLGPDDKTTQSYTLIGCLISYQHGMSLSQTPDPVQPTLTIEYDDFHVSAGGTTW